MPLGLGNADCTVNRKFRPNLKCRCRSLGGVQAVGEEFLQIRMGGGVRQQSFAQRVYWLGDRWRGDLPGGKERPGVMREQRGGEAEGEAAFVVGARCRVLGAGVELVPDEVGRVRQADGDALAAAKQDAPGGVGR